MMGSFVLRNEKICVNNDELYIIRRHSGVSRQVRAGFLMI